MTIRNYLAYLGIDGTAVLSEETKTEQYICKAFHLKKRQQKETLSSTNSAKTWIPALAGCSLATENRDRE